MKKLLLVLISLMLCCSLLFVGCDDVSDRDDDDKGGQTADNGNDDDKEQAEKEAAIAAAKQSIVENFNKIDLSGFFDTASGDAEKVDMSQLKCEGQFMMSVKNAGGMAYGFSMKDSYVYFATMQGDGSAMSSSDAFMYFTDTKYFTFSREDEGEWYMNVTDMSGTESDTDVSTGIMDSILSSDMSEYEELVDKIKIPALKTEHLIEKGDMFVIDNAYFVDVFKENIPLISEIVGDTPTADEEAEAIKEIEDALEEMGLEVALKTLDGKIVKLSISLTPTDADGMGLKNANITVELTDDAKNLKKLEMGMVTPPEFDKTGYDLTYVYKLETIMDGAELVGANIELSADTEDEVSWTSTSSGSLSGNVTEYYKSIVCYEKMVIKEVIDIRNPNVITATATLDTVKIFEVENHYDEETFELIVDSAKDVTSEKKTEYANDIDIEVKVNKTSPSHYELSGTFAVDGAEADIDGYLELNDAPNFPTVPTEILNYINSNK